MFRAAVFSTLPSPIRTVTVGTGVSPVLRVALAGFTAGREFHPAPKISADSIIGVTFQACQNVRKIRGLSLNRLPVCDIARPGVGTGESILYPCTAERSQTVSDHTLVKARKTSRTGQTRKRKASGAQVDGFIGAFGRLFSVTLFGANWIARYGSAGNGGIAARGNIFRCRKFRT